MLGLQTVAAALTRQQSTDHNCCSSSRPPDKRSIAARRTTAKGRPPNRPSTSLLTAKRTSLEPDRARQTTIDKRSGRGEIREQSDRRAAHHPREHSQLDPQSPAHRAGNNRATIPPRVAHRTGVQRPVRRLVDDSSASRRTSQQERQTSSSLAQWLRRQRLDAEGPWFESRKGLSLLRGRT